MRGKQVHLYSCCTHMYNPFIFISFFSYSSLPPSSFTFGIVEVQTTIHLSSTGRLFGEEVRLQKKNWEGQTHFTFLLNSVGVKRIDPSGVQHHNDLMREPTAIDDADRLPPTLPQVCDHNMTSSTIYRTAVQFLQCVSDFPLFPLYYLSGTGRLFLFIKKNHKKRPPYGTACHTSPPFFQIFDQKKNYNNNREKKEKLQGET